MFLNQQYQEDKNGKKKKCRGTSRCLRCRAIHRCHEIKLPLCEKDVRQCEDETGNGNDFFDVHENDNEDNMSDNEEYHGKKIQGRSRESPIIKAETSHSSGIILRGDSSRRRTSGHNSQNQLTSGQNQLTSGHDATNDNEANTCISSALYQKLLFKERMLDEIMKILSHNTRTNWVLNPDNPFGET